MTEQYKIDYIENKCSDEYTKIMTLANCVQSKKLSDVFSCEITEKNYDSLCSIDIHNLPYLHYLTFYLLNNKTDTTAYNKLINGFSTHQGIGFTIFVYDITGRNMTLEQKIQQMKQMKRYLKKLYKKSVSSNMVYITIFVITIIDIIHHVLRALSSSLYLIFEPKNHYIVYRILLYIGFHCLPIYIFIIQPNRKNNLKNMCQNQFYCRLGYAHMAPVTQSCHHICDTILREYLDLLYNN